MSPSMCKVVAAVFFLACSAQGRRVRTADEQVESNVFAQRNILERQALARLLSVRHSTAAFGLSGLHDSASNRHPGGVHGLQVSPRRALVRLGMTLEEGKEKKLAGKKVKLEKGIEEKLKQGVEDNLEEDVKDKLEEGEDKLEEGVKDKLEEGEDKLEEGVEEELGEEEAEMKRRENMTREEAQEEWAKEFDRLKEEYKDSPLLDDCLAAALPPLKPQLDVIGMDPGELALAIKGLTADEDHGKFVGMTVNSPILSEIIKALDDPDVLGDDTAVQVPSPLLLAALMCSVEPPDNWEEESFELSALKLAASEMTEIDSMLRGVAPGIGDEKMRAMMVAQLCCLDASSTLSGIPMEVDEVMPQMVPQVTELLRRKLKKWGQEYESEDLHLPACLFMTQFFEQFEDSWQAEIERQMDEAGDVENFEPNGPTPKDMRESALNFMKWMQADVTMQDILDMLPPPGEEVGADSLAPGIDWVYSPDGPPNIPRVPISPAEESQPGEE